MSAPEAALRRLVETGRFAADGATRDDLVAALGALLARVHAAWPRLRTSDERFVDALARHAPEGETVARWLSTVHAEDLYLATACAAGEEAAFAELDARFLADVGAYIRGVDRSGALADETRQALREKLLVGRAGAPPRIATYRGHGPLAGFLRLAAVRTARDQRRAQSSPATRAAVDERLRSPSADPFAALLEARHAEELRAVLESVVAGLPAEERAILKLHFLEGMKTDDVARLYGVDGSTIRRRVAAVRAAIVKTTRRRLAERLALAPAEVDSAIALLQSHFDASVSRWLRD